MVGWGGRLPSPSQASSATRLERRSSQRPSSPRGETAPAAILGEGRAAALSPHSGRAVSATARTAPVPEEEAWQRRKLSLLGGACTACFPSAVVSATASPLLPGGTRHGLNAAASLPASKMAARRKRCGDTLASLYGGREASGPNPVGW